MKNPFRLRRTPHTKDLILAALTRIEAKLDALASNEEALRAMQHTLDTASTALKTAQDAASK